MRRSIDKKWKVVVKAGDVRIIVYGQTRKAARTKAREFIDNYLLIPGQMRPSPSIRN
jgi:hypothetical protein